MLLLIISPFFRSRANTFLLHLQVCVGMGGYVWYVWCKANISLNEKSEPIEIDVIGLSWVIIAIGKSWRPEFVCWYEQLLYLMTAKNS